MFIRTDIGKTFGVELIQSSEMNAALELWDNISSERPPWRNAEDDIKPYNMGIFYEHTRNPVYCGRNDKFIVEAYVLSIRPDFAIEVRATFRT